MPRLTKTFTARFGHAPAGVWSAPGRVNLIGEHTDYNGGLALPIALPHRTRCAASARDDDLLRIHSLQDDSFVEVRIDDGRWQETTLGPDVGIDYWRQWYLRWDARPGLHRIAVRATDRAGRPQVTERATPFPSGSSGIQEVVVTVA